MNYQELYAGLSQGELRNVAARAHVPIADVRQEALLWCWQVASGRSDYDVRRGSVRQYVMAKLWGLAARAGEVPVTSWMRPRDEDADSVHGLRVAETRQATLSVLDELIDREESEQLERGLQVAQQSLRQERAGLSTMSVLMDEGISSVRIALLIGLTPQAVRQHVAREQARIGRSGSRVNGM